MPRTNTNKKQSKKYTALANFIYETNIHSKTPRSGFWFLGSGNQSVAEHLFHTAMIAYTLAHMEPKADKAKMIMMALFHDIGEGRTSDLNYVHQRYGRLSESRAVADLAQSVPFGEEILSAYTEEQAKETLEAKLVKDADQLELICMLREEQVKGNTKTVYWIETALMRLKTESGKRLGQALVETNPDAWWTDEADAWFVDRDKEKQDWQVGKKSSKKRVKG